MENNPFESRIQHLERRMLYLAGFCCVLFMALVFMMVSSFAIRVKAAADPKVLHLRGLVIEDAQGRARVLLGAPFPKVPDRLRQDDTTEAMVFLDEKGHDRFLVGEVMPAQIGGKVSPNFHRIGSAYGLTIFDLEGNERGGMGFLSNGRAAVVLDRPNGDAVGAMVDDKSGYAGLGVMYSPDLAHSSTGLILGTQGRRVFLTFKSIDDIPRATFAISSEGKPSFQLFGKTGKPGQNLLSSQGR